MSEDFGGQYCCCLRARQLCSGASSSAGTPGHAPDTRRLSLLGRRGVLAALALPIVSGAPRYNIFSVLGHSSIFGLVALGTACVILTGGIDLSVSSVATFASVMTTLLNPHGLWITLLGQISGLVIADGRVLPSIDTLTMLLAARLHHPGPGQPFCRAGRDFSSPSETIGD